MASESTIPEQLRASLFPILIGLMGPTPGSDPDRVVLVNPVTQGMVVIRGGAAAISEIIAAGGGGEVGGGAPPASKASIEAMRSVETSELESEEECSMCLDAMKKEDENAAVKEMPCRHRFHGDCIEKWLKMHGSCPVCRYQMPIEEEEEREGDKRRGRRESEVWITIAFRRREREGDDEDREGDEDRDE